MEQKEGVPPSYQARSTAVAALPPGWEEMKDPRSGKTFYVNHITKSTTWDRPVAEAIAAPPSYSAVAVAPTSVDFYKKAAKPAAQFTSRIVVGQKVRIKKQYQDISAKEIGTAVSTNPNGSVEILFGRRKIGLKKMRYWIGWNRGEENRPTFKIHTQLNDTELHKQIHTLYLHREARSQLKLKL